MTSAESYPRLAWWVANQGWVEIGHDDFSRSFVRALDIGGLLWEGEPSYPTLDDALAALDAGIQSVMDELGFP